MSFWCVTNVDCSSSATRECRITLGNAILRLLTSEWCGVDFGGAIHEPVNGDNRVGTKESNICNLMVLFNVCGWESHHTHKVRYK